MNKISPYPLIDKALKMFENLFNGKYDPLEFSLDMELYLFDNSKKMNKENYEITEFLNQDTPDACALAEPNFDPTEMLEMLKPIYKKAREMREKLENK